MATAVGEMVTITGEVAAAIAAASLTLDLELVTYEHAGRWDNDDTVVSTYFPQYDLNDLRHMRCTVVPGSFASDGISRSAKQETYGVDVVLQRGKRRQSDDERDELLTVAGEITAVLEYGTLSTSGAVCVGVADSTVFDLDMLEEHGIMASATRYLYRLIRAV